MQEKTYRPLRKYAAYMLLLARRKVIVLAKTGNKRKLLSFKNIHSGKQCIIMATGPSLNKVDLSLIAEHPFVFGVNAAFIKRNDFRYYFCSSLNFYKPNKKRIKKINAEHFFFSTLIGLTSNFNASYIHIEEKSHLWKTAPKTFTADILKPLSWGPGVLLELAVPVAIWMGFSEIILLGADYSLGSYERFYTEKKSGLSHKKEMSQKQHHYENAIAHNSFNNLKHYLSGLQKPVKIYNCSPLSDLKAFEKVGLEQIIK